MELQKEITSLLNYYARYCDYPLDTDQIFTLLPYRTDRKTLDVLLAELVHKGLVIKDTTSPWYTIQKMNELFDKRKEREVITNKKIQLVNRYISLLWKLPWIRSIILTGSCALNNATQNDDIDLMIITSTHTMFLCRMYALFLAELCGVRKKRTFIDQPNAVCINIFIDESALEVPHQKRGIYGGCEIVSSLVLHDKNMFSRFLTINAKWIDKVLPNWEISKNILVRPKTQRTILKMLNTVSGMFQLSYMKLHTTNEVLSTSQLWLHPKLRQ